MAVLVMDSFDDYATADLALIGWSELGGGGTVTILAPPDGRWGTQCLELYDWDEGCTRVLPAAYATVTVGFAFKVVTLATVATPIMRWYDGTTLHMRLMLNTDGSLFFQRGDGTQVGSTSSAGLFTVDTWHHFTAKVLIHDSTGTVDLWVNGSSSAAISNTGLDTRNGGNATTDRIRLGGETNEGGKPLYDDLYATDGANLGDARVQCLLPSGNGNSSQFTGSDANSTDNYLLVDDPDDSDDDTTYVQSNTVSQKDTYALPSLAAATGTVHAVQVSLYAKKNDAGARSVASVMRLSGGTEADSANRALTGSYAFYNDIRETKPGGGAWSITDVNGAEAGVKVTV